MQHIGFYIFGDKSIAHKGVEIEERLYDLKTDFAVFN